MLTIKLIELYATDVEQKDMAATPLKLVQLIQQRLPRARRVCLTVKGLIRLHKHLAASFQNHREDELISEYAGKWGPIMWD